MMNLNIPIAILVAVLFSACATRPTSMGSGPNSVDRALSKTDDSSDGSDENDLPIVKLKEVDSFRVTDPEAPKIVAEEFEQIPVEINPLVEKWIDYFQGRGRPHMERYLARSTRYMKLMKTILAKNGLPEDLVYIAMIESGFSSKATSHAAAVGYWQFIRGTGKRYGLEISSMVDDRRDPVVSTQAAAEYFKGLYSVFGSWYLAMASYNVGENRVKREVMNHMSRDFWVLAHKKRFPKETINYIPKFIAAKLIGNNPEKYGFTEIDYMTPIEFEHIVVKKPVNLKLMAEKMNLDYDDFKQLNPKFKGEIAPLKGSELELRIPIGQRDLALASAQASFVDKVVYIADAGETVIYNVRSGDSLYSIARRYRTTVAWLKDTNDLKNGRKLRIGKRLMVPDRGGKSARVVAKADKRPRQKEDTEKASKSPELVTSKGVFYLVQSGDTLSGIADDYNSTVEELRRMNKMSRGSILKAGMKLKVPKDEGLPKELAGAKLEKLAGSREPQAVVRLNDDGHLIRPGDNLTSISKKYGVSIQAIRKANRLGKRAILKVGARLVIPVPRQSRREGTRVHRAKFHVVKRGENLHRIASKYNVPISALVSKNSINKNSKLFVGAKLMIPNAMAK
jgi:membrane-bound lytic murein transglycosylase D